jgi:hypothetical protein
MSLDNIGRRVAKGLSVVTLVMGPIVLIAAQNPPAAQNPAAQNPPAPAAGQPPATGQTPATPPAVAQEPPRPPGLAGAFQGTPANDTAKGAAVLAEVRKALGGEERFKAVQRLEIKGKSARAMGTGAVEGDIEFQMELPDKFRRKEGLSLSNNNDRGFVIDILQVMNGVMAMQKVEAGSGQNLGNFEEGGGNRGRGGRGNFNVSQLLGPPTEGLDPRARAEAEHAAIAAEMARFMALILVAPPEPVAWIGTAKSPDGSAHVLEFKTPDGVTTRMLVDERRHVPLMVSWTGFPSGLSNRTNNNNNRGGGRGRDGGGNRGGSVAPTTRAPLQVYVSDYKSVSGLRLPHLVQSGANDETNEELVVKSYRINPPFKPEIFSVQE